MTDSANKENINLNYGSNKRVLRAKTMPKNSSPIKKSIIRKSTSTTNKTPIKRDLEENVSMQSSPTNSTTRRSLTRSAKKNICYKETFNNSNKLKVLENPMKLKESIMSPSTAFAKLSVASSIKSPKNGFSPRKGSSNLAKSLTSKRKLNFTTNEVMEVDEADNSWSLESVKNRLHSSKLPHDLWTREEECREIRKFLDECLKGRQRTGDAKSVYIAGVPGTGKTASVLKVIENLQNEKKHPFDFIVVNALEIADNSNKIFPIIYKKLTGSNTPISPQNAQEKLNDMFTSSKKRRPLILFVDEMDMLCLQKSQATIYRLADWTVNATSKVIFIGVSNTLDLPERDFKHRVLSRFGVNRITFQAYVHDDMLTILRNRIGDCDMIDDKAIELAARKVASFSGDLRRAMEILRDAIDIAMEKCTSENLDKKEAKVTTNTIMEAINRSEGSIVLEYCLGLSPHEECLLRTIVTDLEICKAEDTIFGRVFDRYKPVCLAKGLVPLSASAAFQLVMDIASTRLIILNSEPGVMNRKVRLGIEGSMAKLCINKMDVRDKEMNKEKNF